LLADRGRVITAPGGCRRVAVTLFAAIRPSGQYNESYSTEPHLFRVVHGAGEAIGLRLS